MISNFLNSQKNAAFGDVLAGAVEEPIVTEDVVVEPTAEPIVEPVVEPTKEPIIEPTNTNDGINSFDLLKEFGYEKKEDLKSELEALRKIKENPFEHIQFDNEETKEFLQYVKEGKTKELTAFLKEKEELESLADKTPAELLRMKIKLENKHYSSEDVEDVFEQRYEKPEKPEQDLEETDDDYDARIAKWQTKVDKIDRAIKRDAVEAQDKIKELTKNISLAKLFQSPNQPTKEELEAAKEEKIKSFTQALESGYKEYNGFNTTFKNDKGVVIEASVVIDAKLQSELKDFVENLNINEFMDNRWFKDGKPNIKQLMHDMLRLTKEDVYVKQLVETASRNSIANYEKSIKNIDIDNNGGTTVEQSGSKFTSFGDAVAAAKK